MREMQRFNLFIKKENHMAIEGIAHDNRTSMQKVYNKFIKEGIERYIKTKKRRKK